MAWLAPQRLADSWTGPSAGQKICRKLEQYGGDIPSDYSGHALAWDALPRGRCRLECPDTDFHGWADVAKDGVVRLPRSMAVYGRVPAFCLVLRLLPSSFGGRDYLPGLSLQRFRQ